jgi:hypothetical protein
MRSLADPWMKARFAGLGGAVIAGSPADFGQLTPGPPPLKLPA